MKKKIFFSVLIFSVFIIFFSGIGYVDLRINKSKNTQQGELVTEVRTFSECSDPGKEENDAAISAYLTVDWTAQEMLISFTANHCGQNSLYVYQYRDNSVFSYMDMIATPDEYVITGIDHKKLSPYMDIDLVDVYVNQKNECRYLSLDCFGIGGVDQIFLYETVPGDDFRQNLLRSPVIATQINGNSIFRERK